MLQKSHRKKVYLTMIKTYCFLNILKYGTLFTNIHFLGLNPGDIFTQSSLVSPGSRYKFSSLLLASVNEVLELMIPHPIFQDVPLPLDVPFSGMCHLGRLHSELSNKYLQFG